VLVAAFEGSQRTGGFAIPITKIERDGAGLVVRATIFEGPRQRDRVAGAQFTGPHRVYRPICVSGVREAVLLIRAALPFRRRRYFGRSFTSQQGVRVAHAVKWAIMSTANINRKVIPGAHASPKVELVAVASRDQARADEYAKTWEIQRAYGSYDALLADPEVEAVYISLPNSMHCEWAIKALEAGKHVLCEKPLSRRASEVEGVFDTADRTGRLLSEAFMYRHNPQTKRAKQLVDEGAIGELRLIRSAFSYSLYDENNIRLRTALDGGALMDVGCYAVSGSRLFGGEPEKAYGEAWFGPSGTDWVFAGTLRFPANVVALFDCGTALTERDELEAIGSEGSLFLDDPWHCKVPGIELRREGRVERIELDVVDSYRLELENLSDAIRGDGELLLGRDDAVAQARVLEALHDSAMHGAPVSL
jgi:predicted dehydrogenase